MYICCNLTCVDGAAIIDPMGVPWWSFRLMQVLIVQTAAFCIRGGLWKSMILLVHFLLVLIVTSVLLRKFYLCKKFAL